MRSCLQGPLGKRPGLGVGFNCKVLLKLDLEPQHSGYGGIHSPLDCALGRPGPSSLGPVSVLRAMFGLLEAEFSDSHSGRAIWPARSH